MSLGPGHASGWYWTEKMGSSLCVMPSTVPSLTLTCSTSRPVPSMALRVDGVAVVLGGDEHPVLVLHRLVRAAVAELHLVGVCPPKAMASSWLPMQMPMIG